MLLVHAIAAHAKPKTADSYANITGVPLWGQQHYVNGYRCADGTIIPRARVNDDACDCVDGGDEPGTAACAGRQQFFWCAADRRFVPSSRVGDGVVDCCDGADETMRDAPPTGPRLARLRPPRREPLAEALVRRVLPQPQRLDAAAAGRGHKSYCYCYSATTRVLQQPDQMQRPGLLRRPRAGPR